MCYEINCSRCKGWRCGDHVCAIQPKCCKPPLADGRLRFFDFESDPNAGGYHVPNLAVVSSDGVDFKVYKNHGLSIIDQFVYGEFNDENRGCTYVAHNAKGYDAHFIKEALSRLGMQYEYIPNGHKIMELKILKLGIRIIDSVNFIQCRLSDFPEMFDLGDVCKGLYPYAFNTRENWNYVGPMPPLELFLPHGVAYEIGDESRVISKDEQRHDDELKLTAECHETVRWHKEQVG